jgi:hypothetical protein
MTVTRRDSEGIILEGTCGAEDAEPLLQMLIETPGARLDWRPCSQLHTAVAQVVLTAGPVVEGPCGDAWIEKWLSQGTFDSRRAP